MVGDGVTGLLELWLVGTIVEGIADGILEGDVDGSFEGEIVGITEGVNDVG